MKNYVGNLKILLDQQIITQVIIMKNILSSNSIKIMIYIAIAIAPHNSGC